MTDDIRGLTAQWAADPGSLVFLRLGEALLAERRLDAAAKVAVQGLNRYPNLPDAHALYARILVEQGSLENAFDEWEMAARLDPGHIGAHKGLGYLYFKAGDLASALYHLELAAAGGEEESVRVALAKVRERIQKKEQGEPSQATTRARYADEPPLVPVAGPLPLGESGLLLVNLAGLRLEGTLMQGIEDVSDHVAAELAGVSREAIRAVRLLGLGEWQSIAVEATGGNFFLVPPTPETLLLVQREPRMPMGRVALAAMRARDAARQWLERAP